MKWLEEQKGLYHTLGAARFFGIYLALIIYLMMFVWLLIWLSNETGWPEAYGSRCHGRGCWPNYLWHSFGLLRGATAHEIALFVVLWHLPATLAIFVTVIIGKRQYKRWKKRIRPMGR